MANPTPPATQTAPQKVIILNSQGLKLAGHLDDSACKDLCILCHGFRSSKELPTLISISKALIQAGLSAFRFDFTGNGESEGEFAYGNYWREAEDLRAVVKYWQFRARTITALIGHSKGGNAVLLYASKYQDVPNVVNISGRFDLRRGELPSELMSTNVCKTLRKILYNLSRQYLFLSSAGSLPLTCMQTVMGYYFAGIKGRLGGSKGVKKLEEDGVLDVYDKAGNFEFRVLKKDVDERLSTDMHTASISIPPRCKVLTIHGSGDEIVPAEDALEFAKRIPKHTLRVIEGADHNYKLQQSELAALVVSFLLAFVVTASLGQSTNNTTVYEPSTISILSPIRIYGNNSYPVYHRRALPLSATRARYPGFHQESLLLKEGTVRREGSLPLPCDIVFERDVALKLRDNITIYTNVFRPVGSGTWPALVAWSPYGKEIGGQWLDDITFRAGIPLSTQSELQKFEGPDPAYWINHNYVVLNPDARGVGNSEGNITYWGRQLAEDGYDFIEWAATQPWCNGEVALTGTSYLTVSQWFIAAEKPPHLTAIAPWEGFVDAFREAGNNGGIPTPTLGAEGILQSLSGNNLIEDQPRMMLEDQLTTPYWKDKEARLGLIDVPAFIVASYTHQVHTHGTFAGFRGISSPQKWLRVHNSSEWPNYYDATHVDDLRRFFDHFLKSVNNGWETTPRVRLCVLDPGGIDIVDRAEEEFPLARTLYRKLYLNSNNTFSQNPLSTPIALSYQVVDPSLQQTTSEVVFIGKFTAETEFTGYMSLKLWVEAKGSNDMELNISVEKLNATGDSIPTGIRQTTITATGALRVSHRKLDSVRSTPSEPFLANDNEQLLQVGEIVPVEINIWPMGMRYHVGEQLSLTISPYFVPPPIFTASTYGEAEIILPAEGGTFVPGTVVKNITLGGSSELPDFVVNQAVAPLASRNNGTHIFHMGGQYDSYLMVPVIPKPTSNR